MQYFRKAPLITIGSPSWKKLGHQALHSMLIYCERRPTSCRKLIFNSLRNMGLSLKLFTSWKLCCQASALENNQMSHHFVTITFGFAPERHMDIKASLVKSGEVTEIKSKGSLVDKWLLYILHSHNKASSVPARNLCCMSASYLSNCLIMAKCAKKIIFKKVWIKWIESAECEGIGR